MPAQVAASSKVEAPLAAQAGPLVCRACSSIQAAHLLKVEGALAAQAAQVDSLEAEGNHRKIIKTQGHLTQCS